MNPNINVDKLQIKDIKPPVDIPDISYYLWWGLVILAGILVLGVIVWIVFYILKSRSKVPKEKIWLQQLHNIDWSDPKKSAYLATKYGRLLAQDDRRKELFNQLLPLLEQYKYKKSVSQVDSETKKRFELYRQVCDESI